MRISRLRLFWRYVGLVKKAPPTKPPAGCSARACAGKVTPEADLTWLLHRAAQRMHGVMEEQAVKHGVSLRGYLVLTALSSIGPSTQWALGQAIGLDKTTLTTLLDRLEQAGLLVRQADPQDRRARIPDVTQTGRELQVKVANDIAAVEAALLAGFTAAEQQSLRTMLCQLIGGAEGSKTSFSG